MKKASLFLLWFSILFSSCSEKQNDPSPEENVNSYYKEQHRPQFHFSPEEQWMNDPNGMVFYEGEYHLFYQHYPDSNVWGPMHWGHAISEDLLHWNHLPIALAPDDLGHIFSGSAVVDWNNTSGFGQNSQPPMVAIYTYHKMEGEKAGRNDYQTQGIAYSNDKGRSWTKYYGNPVIPNPGIKDFRDPKVIWDDRSSQWVMVFAAYDHVKIWSSPDLKSWTHLSDFGREWGNHGGVWECPDLFPLTVEGTDEQKWVLLLSINPGSPNGGSGTQYFIGQFDGKTFTLDEQFASALVENDGKTAIWIDYGRDNYAGVTWSDIPDDDGRRIFMGWMSNWDYAQIVPTYKWRSAMTIPRELILKNTSAGPRLFSVPVDELANNRTTAINLETQDVEGELDLTDKLDGNLSQVEIELTLITPQGSGSGIILEFSNSKNERYLIGYDADRKEYFSDRRQSGKIDFSPKFGEVVHYAPRIVNDQEMTLHLFMDVSSAELFADGGASALTDIFFPSEDYNRLKILSGEGMIQIKSGKISKLNSIWQ